MKKLSFLCITLVLLLTNSLAYSQDSSVETHETQDLALTGEAGFNEIGEIRDQIYTSRDIYQLSQNVRTTSSSTQKTSKDTSRDTVLDTLDLKNMDVLDVLKLISLKSKLNIIAGQNVKGRVTVFLKDIEVMQALKIIVEAYGWAYAVDGEVIKVMTAKEYEDRYGHKFGEEVETRIKQLIFTNTADILPVLTQIKSVSGKVLADDKSNNLILIDSPAKLEEMEVIIKRIDVPVKTEIFELSYAKAEEISNKIAEVLTPGLGTMKFDERSNKIVVSDTARKISEVDDIITAFDQKDKEVLIEAKILQITLNDEHKLGVDWEAIVRDYHELNFQGDFDVLGATDKKGQVSIGTIDNDDYRFLVEALDTVGVTDILSSPRIATVNNQEAKILVGSTEPYVTTTVTTPSSGPTTTAESVNFIEVGVKLFVTPTIHKDNFVSMKIKPEVSSVVDQLQTSNNNTIPVVGTTEAETTILVKDGVTVVIGGLIEEEKRTTTRQIPVLGKIPVLGTAFRNETDSVSKQEIVVFLTPKIMTGDVGDAALY